jgi:hypothetical protein
MITTIEFFSTDKRKIKMVLPFHQIEASPKRLAVYLTNETLQENHFNCSSTTAAVRFESFLSHYLQQ